MEKSTRAIRLRRRIEVRYGPRSPEHTGYSGNISRSGVMIRAVRIYGPGTPLMLELMFPGKKIVARGVVTWARQGSILLLPSGRIGMGLKFVAPPAELLALLAAGGSV